MTIADTVRMYLISRPHTLLAVESNIVNYSALAREICSALNINNYAAVKACIYRYAVKTRRINENTERRSLDLFSGNRLTLLDGIAVIISREELNVKHNAEVRLGSYYAYFAESGTARKMTKTDKSKIIKIRDSCSALVLYSGPQLENAIGALSFLTSLLAGQNINIIETISCYTETIFVVDRKDAFRSYELLSALTRMH
jgi:aspartokinase